MNAFLILILLASWGYAAAPIVVIPPTGTATPPGGESTMTYDADTGEMNDPGTRLPYPAATAGTPITLCEHVREWWVDTSVVTYPRICVCPEAGQPPLCLNLAYASQFGDGVGASRTCLTPDCTLNYPDGEAVAFDVAGTPPVITLTPKLKIASQANGDLIARTGGAWTRFAKCAAGESLAYDANGPVCLAQARVLNHSATQVVVSNTKVETTVYSFTVPGGTLGANSCLRVNLGGDQFKNAAVSVTYRMKYGTGVVASVAIGWGSSTTRRGYEWIGHVCNNNATNSQKLWMNSQFQTIGGVTYYGTGAVDSTVNQEFSVTVEWASADANTEFVKERAYLELLP